MPSGYESAKQVGDFSGGSRSFVQKPRGIKYFSLKNDREEAVVRFLVQHEEIPWMRQWKTDPKPGFPWGEKLPCVDQHEEGLPDPGFELGMKSTWTGYLQLIWRNAIAFQRDAQGRVIKDGNGNPVIAGYEDTISLWEVSWNIYDMLRNVEADYQGLMSRDFIVRRNGARGDTKTTYDVRPAVIDGGPTPFSQADQQLFQTQQIDLSPFLKIPTYEELATYLNGGQPVPQVAPQPMQQSVPVQHQQMQAPQALQPAPPAAPDAGPWPAPPPVAQPAVQQLPTMPAPQQPPAALPAQPVAPAPALPNPSDPASPVNPFFNGA